MTPADQHALREALARAEAERDEAEAKAKLRALALFVAEERFEQAASDASAWHSEYKAERRAKNDAEARALAAEAENTRLKETVEAARAALKPFADEAVRFDSRHEELALPDEMILPAGLTLGHARAARSVLATIPPKENP